ncbi:MAG: DUF4416 family protein [Planctomycetes bacterium]|nr:DUF4416 family protein [Planctomycetota bacterium]
MAKACEPKPVKCFCGMLAGDVSLFDVAAGRLAEQYGEIDAESETFDFDFTDYYKEEMGPGLKKKFVSFRDLIDPIDLVEIKLATNDLESEIAGQAGGSVARPINLDPGYLTLSKLVLATAKDYSHRLYLGRGIYAEVTLRYQGGRFVDWPWTYPDYKTPEYQAFFKRLRGIYVAQCRPE